MEKWHSDKSQDIRSIQEVLSSMIVFDRSSRPSCALVCDKTISFLGITKEQRDFKEVQSNFFLDAPEKGDDST